MTKLLDACYDKPDEPEYFTAAEVRFLLTEQADIFQKMFEQRDAEIRRLEGRINSQGVWIEEFRGRMGSVERDLLLIPLGEPPTNNLDTLPPFKEITKIQAQFFDNQERNRLADIEAKKQGKKRGAKLPTFQIKLYVWTCPQEDWTKYACGNCNKDGYLIPLHKSQTSHSRTAFGDKLNWLGEKTLEALTRIGCVTKRGTRGRQYPQHVAGMKNNNLYLFFRDEYEVLNLGDLPKGTPTGAEQNASRHTWFWPDTTGVSFRDSSMGEGMDC